MDPQIQMREILTSEFTRAKTYNPSFSLRAFARKTGLVPSALSEILAGKRRVTIKMAKRIFDRLSIEPDHAEEILQLIKNRNSKLEINSEGPDYMRVNMDHYHVISEWYYFAILSLAETENFRSEPKWIAKRLNINVQDALVALKRLERLQMLKRDGKKLVTTGCQFETSSDILNLSLRKSHFQNLELAKRSLEVDDLQTRDFSSMTMAIDPGKLPEAKKMIKNFRRRFCAYLESGKKKEVYRICIQLIPLTLEGKK